MTSSRNRIGVCDLMAYWRVVGTGASGSDEAGLKAFGFGVGSSGVDVSTGACAAEVGVTGVAGGGSSGVGASGVGGAAARAGCFA